MALQHHVKCWLVACIHQKATNIVFYRIENGVKESEMEKGNGKILRTWKTIHAQQERIKMIFFVYTIFRGFW